MNRTVAWALWLPVVAALTLAPFLWHVDYFKNPGPQFYQLALVLLPATAASALLYSFFLRRHVRPFEPAILFGVPLAMAVCYEPRAAVVLLAIALSAAAAGRYTLRCFSFDSGRPVAAIALPAVLGLAEFVLVMTILGYCGWYSRWAIAALLTLPIVIWRRDAANLIQAARALLRRWSAASELDHPVAGIAVFFAALLSLLSLMAILSPAIAYDVVSAHLPIVRHYALEHALRPLDTVHYSYYPQAGEILMTVGFLCGGQPAAQMISPMCFLLFLLLVFATAREWGASAAPSLAGAIFAAALPFLHWTGSVAKNDTLLAAFQIAALFCYLRWLKTRLFAWILLGTCFLAAGFGVKHVAIFGAVPLGILFGYAIWKTPRRWLAAAGVTVLFAAISFHWYVRTFRLTGNPLYPESIHRVENPSIAQHAATPAGRGLRYITLPWDLHFRGGKTFESPSPNPMGIFLVAFLPVWLLSPRAQSTPQERACIFFAVLYLLIWGTIGSTLRYAIVPITLLFVLTTVRLFRVHDAVPRAAQVSIAGVAVYCFLFTMCMVMILEVNGPLLNYFARRIDKREYLRQALRPYPAMDYLLDHASSRDWIFGADNRKSVV
jgi:hypothetical protein